MTEPKLLIDPEITVPTSTTPFIKQDPEAEVELPNEMANVKVKVDPEIEIHISSSSSSSSPSKKRSHEEMQPLASAPTNTKPPTSTPFETIEKKFHDFRKQYDLKTSIPHIIWSVSDPVQEVHGKWEVQEWGEERKKEEESKLTQADIDLHHHAMILPRSTYTLFGLRNKEITYADTRNDPSDFCVMLNTQQGVSGIDSDDDSMDDKSTDPMPETDNAKPIARRVINDTEEWQQHSVKTRFKLKMPCDEAPWTGSHVLEGVPCTPRHYDVIQIAYWGYLKECKKNNVHPNLLPHWVADPGQACQRMPWGSAPKRLTQRAKPYMF